MMVTMIDDDTAMGSVFFFVLVQDASGVRLYALTLGRLHTVLLRKANGRFGDAMVENGLESFPI